MEGQYKVVLTGRDRQIAFPNYCANCNLPASDRLRVQKVFERVGTVTAEDSGIFLIVTSFDVPFCQTCIDLHKKEEIPLTWWNWLKAFLMGGMLIVPAAVIFFLSPNLWRDLLQALTSADLVLTIIYGALSVLSLGVIAMLVIAARLLSRPHLVVPPTSITTAIDFSDRDRARTFRFRHEGFADRFREANRNRLWSPGQSQGGIPWRWLIRLLLLGLVALAVWWLFMLGVL